MFIVSGILVHWLCTTIEEVIQQLLLGLRLWSNKDHAILRLPALRMRKGHEIRTPGGVGLLFSLV